MRIPAEINTIVFDCDGVMFQTGELNRNYYNRLLSKFNLPPMDEDQFEFVKMHTADDSVDHLFQGKVDLHLVDIERKNLSYRDFVPYMEMTKDLMSLLKLLKKEDYKTAIATNRSNTMDLVMDTFDLNDYFNLVVTAADVKNAKPDPEQLYKIKVELGVELENIVYIGDSKLDQIAAQKAGIFFIAFGNPELEAHHHVSEMKQLIEIIR